MITEQDFVLKIRRLHRLNMPQTVVNVIRHMADHSGADTDAVERALQEVTKKYNGTLHVMSNGDSFIVAPLQKEEQRKQMVAVLSALLFPEGAAQDAERTVTLYTLPQDYTSLRERANTYMELARASEVMGPIRQAEAALLDEDVRGVLTPYSLAQVEKLLDNMDIKRYVRTQPVYTLHEDGVWEKLRIDFYVSVTELQRERFPRLNLESPERLFLELCYALDKKLLLEMAGHSDNWLDKTLSLNLSVETVLSSAFAQFCHVLPNTKRHQVSFDVHRSDLFLNFSTTRNALNVLKSEGFGVGIDGITPSVLPYIQFGMLGVDYYKINVTREKWAEMQDPIAMRALQSLPVNKIIFSHCDHEEALRIGQSLGVRHYQGWLIDDVALAIAT